MLDPFGRAFNLRAQENPEIVKWLRKRDEKYTSPETQNGLPEAMAPGMMRKISANIHTDATFFTIIADKTADVSNKEQLVICIRWVDDCFVSCTLGEQPLRQTDNFGWALHDSSTSAAQGNTLSQDVAKPY